ncbi:MAG TPA: hypothetical protein VMZ27_13420 [Candidatus Saccharimonadales bacterium]|jgi:hypothetical protein|nr:hypothetical protein [Candidatus Saccharimonadales bacterium]
MNKKTGNLKKAPRSKKEEVRKALREAVDLPPSILVRLVGKKQAALLCSGETLHRFRHD